MLEASKDDSYRAVQCASAFWNPASSSSGLPWSLDSLGSISSNLLQDSIGPGTEQDEKFGPAVQKALEEANTGVARIRTIRKDLNPRRMDLSQNGNFSSVVPSVPFFPERIGT